MDKSTTCCFTGHRPDKLPWGEDETDPRCLALKQRLAAALEDIYRDGVRHFICGMARGADLYFAEAVLAHGTTGIMTDLHEVGVVSGLEGIEAILKEAEATDLKIYFVVPSHVPFSPNLETSGGHFNPEIIRKALKRPDAVGLSECVGPISQPGSPICWSPLTPRCPCPARPCRAICRICTARP